MLTVLSVSGGWRSLRYTNIRKGRLHLACPARGAIRDAAGEGAIGDKMVGWGERLRRPGMLGWWADQQNSARSLDGLTERYASA